MGCDIHLFVETRNHDTGAWELRSDAPRLHHRNYAVFAILANQRNGEGFTPISEPRGLPPDVSNALAAIHANDVAEEPDESKEDADGEAYGDYWVGDHSFSWLTLAELLEWRQSFASATDDRRRIRDLYDRFIPELFAFAHQRSLNPTDVRIVFGFDS